MVGWFDGSVKSDKAYVLVLRTEPNIMNLSLLVKQYSLVVWFGASVMSIAVNQECVVQCVQISEHEANVVCAWQTFAPEVPWQHSWQQNRNNRHDDPVVAANWKYETKLEIDYAQNANDVFFLSSNLLLLDHNEWIGQTVAHINRFPFFIDLGPFGHHQPAHVREKQSTTGVVRIGITVLVFVMYTMVMYPNPDPILMSNRIEEGQN